MSRTRRSSWTEPSRAVRKEDMSEESERKYVENVPTELQDLIYAGKKIPAIKLAREKLGLGLKEAKDRVEQAEAAMRAEFPEALPAKQAAGCGSALFVAAVLVGGAGYLGLRLIAQV